jgi:hypothetical protein
MFQRASHWCALYTSQCNLGGQIKTLAGPSDSARLSHLQDLPESLDLEESNKNPLSKHYAERERINWKQRGCVKSASMRCSCKLRRAHCFDIQVEALSVVS